MVCTANVVRSPIAAALLGARLRDRGVAAVVTSAGTTRYGLPVSDQAVAVAAELGCAIHDHVPRVVTAEIVGEDGVDLVLAMARHHLRDVAVLDPAALPRTFTLKDLVRRSHGTGARRDGEDIGAWLGRLAEGRELRRLLGDDPTDDIEDPYGRSRAVHRRVAGELAHLVGQLLVGARW